MTGNCATLDFPSLLVSEWVTEWVGPRDAYASKNAKSNYDYSYFMAQWYMKYEAFFAKKLQAVQQRAKGNKFLQVITSFR